MERKDLRLRLQDNHLTFVWLINVMKRNGYEIDKSTMSSAINGTLSDKRTNEILSLAHKIVDEYEKTYQELALLK